LWGNGLKITYLYFLKQEITAGDGFTVVAGEQEGVILRYAQFHQQKVPFIVNFLAVQIKNNIELERILRLVLGRFRVLIAHIFR